MGESEGDGEGEAKGEGWPTHSSSICSLSSSLGLLVRRSSTGSSAPSKERIKSDGRSARSAPGKGAQQAKGV